MAHDRIDQIVRAIVDGDGNVVDRIVKAIPKHAPSADIFTAISDDRRWKSIAETVVEGREPAPFPFDQFGSYWITFGRHIREQIANDRLLRDFLRRTLPPYEGETVTLFRGENLERWSAGVVGFAWTPDIAVARRFGKGLNADQTGGVLLKCIMSPTSIISGPNAHSNYLGEQQFTIDPFVVSGVNELERYPPCFRRD